MQVRRRQGSIFRQLQTLYNIGTIKDLTDGQLLERFATAADEFAELALSALVERHEAMVWRVCLAILRDEHAAEDAFQATFLILVSKARSLWVRDSLGPWLHQVAYRTASYFRTTAIRRRKHELRCAKSGAACIVEVGSPHDLDLDAAVHEEVNGLPEKYRAPIVLCDLQGRTHQDAARCLGWPIGTVKSRQWIGRGLLRDQLVRRGLGLAVVGAVVESLRPTAVATMPNAVSRTAVNAAMRQSPCLSAGSCVSAQVITLTHGVLRAMFWIRIRFFMVATLGVGIASSGASFCVLGFQKPALNEGQPVPTPPMTSTAQTPQPKISTKAGEQAVTPTPEARLRAQRLAVRKAYTSYKIAQLTRELAELAVEEYEEVKYPEDLATIESEIKGTESDLMQAIKDSDELSIKKAQLALEQLRSKRNALVDYTRSNRIKELRAGVQRARTEESAKEKAALLADFGKLILEKRVVHNTK